MLGPVPPSLWQVPGMERVRGQLVSSARVSLASHGRPFPGYLEAQATATNVGIAAAAADREAGSPV